MAYTQKILTASLLLCFAANTQAQQDFTITTQVTKSNSEQKTKGPWQPYPTRTVATLSNYKPAGKIQLDKFGGRTDKHVKATGFFYAQKINGRWYNIDPLGNAMFNVGIVAVAPGNSDRSRQALADKYYDRTGWAEETIKLLRKNGFNAFGAWTDNTSMVSVSAQSKTPFAYTIIKNFMSDYGKKRGGTYQESGHMGYPDRTIFVFDPQFETFCDEYAKQLTATKDDTNLYGYFSDNELPFERLTLDRYLDKKDTTDPGCIAAKQWLQQRNLTKAQITDSVRNDFLGVVAERYFSTVSKAIKKYDPNHLYLGSRIHSSERKVRQVLQEMGKYVDVIAVNYYREWTPVASEMSNWELWSGKPFIVTEWYVKGEDAGMTNYSGAGWIVATQQDRGNFYQNFTLGLLESKTCVGFQWFKYMDNDPTDKATDPSNIDANKGIVRWDYSTYAPLLDKMKELNTQIYQLADYFDNK